MSEFLNPSGTIKEQNEYILALTRFRASRIAAFVKARNKPHNECIDEISRLCRQNGDEAAEILIDGLVPSELHSSNAPTKPDLS